LAGAGFLFDVLSFARTYGQDAFEEMLEAFKKEPTGAVEIVSRLRDTSQAKFIQNKISLHIKTRLAARAYWETRANLTP
jgi:hypothetical protein